MVGKITILNKEKQFGIIKDLQHNEFEFDFKDYLGDVNELKIGLLLNFESTEQRKAKKCSLKKTEHKKENFEQKYNEPDVIYISKGSEVNGWETLEKSGYRITASGAGDPSLVAEDLKNKAKILNANAIIHYEYYKTTGSEPGTGRGTHYYTIHNYTGIPCNIGKSTKNNNGRTKDQIIKDIDLIAEKLEDRYKKEYREKIISHIFAAIFVLILTVASCVLLPSGINVVAGIIGAVITITLIRVKYDGWWLKRYDYSI